MTFALPRWPTPIALLALLLGACATPSTDIQIGGIDDAVYTAAGRFPAARSGILIAQNAALRDGRGICEQENKRFRPLSSLAGEDPATGEAVYAVRFRCVARRGAAPPIVTPQPATDRRM